MTPIKYVALVVVKGGSKVDAVGGVEVERWGNVRSLGRGDMSGEELGQSLRRRRLRMTEAV